MNPSIQTKAKTIKLMIFDVDGIMTDGSITYNDKGDEIKTFHVRDGFGIELLQKSGIQTAIISGRTSSILEKRAQELKIPHLYQGQKDKQKAFDTLKHSLNLSPAEIAYMGDDFIDIPLLKQVGLGITVPDAPDLVLKSANWVTTQPGGKGAVREVCEFIIQAQGHWEKICEKYTLF